MAFYKDIDFSFTKNTFTNDINIVEDSTAIKQSIKNIILSFPGEKSFTSSFGIGLQKMLFEHDGTLNYTVAFDIKESLSSYEPRISVTSVSTNTSNGDMNLEIKYNYFFEGSVLRDTVTINTNLILN